MKAIYLLHGFASDGDDYLRILPVLQEMYDYVKVATFPGHGKNDNMNNFTPEATFKYLIDEFDKLASKYDVIDVMGVSMGGALGTYLQTQRQFNKLVLLAPANKYLNFKLITNKVNFFIENKRKKRLLKDVDKKKYEEIQRKIDNVNRNTKIAFDFTFKKLLPKYTIRNIRTFTRIVSMCNKDLVEIKNPTLIIWGNLDQLVSKKSIEFDYMICTNKNKKLVIMDDLSHLMFYSTDISKIIDEIYLFLSKD